MSELRPVDRSIRCRNGEETLKGVRRRLDLQHISIITTPASLGQKAYTCSNCPDYQYRQPIEPCRSDEVPDVLEKSLEPLCIDVK